MTMRKSLLLASAAFTLIGAGAAVAESAPADIARDPKVAAADAAHQKLHSLRDNRQEIIGDRRELHEDRKELRDARREGNADAVAAEKVEVKQGREELRDDMRARHEERKELRDDRREHRQEMHGKHQEKRAEHREKRQDRREHLRPGHIPAGGPETQTRPKVDVNAPTTKPPVVGLGSGGPAPMEGRPMEMPPRPRPEPVKEFPRPAVTRQGDASAPTAVIKGAPVSTDAPTADDAAAH
jgi:hypothetical protein